MLSINFKQLCSWKRSSGWGTLPINWWDTGSLVIRWLRYNDPALATLLIGPSRGETLRCSASIYIPRYQAVPISGQLMIDATFKIYIIFTFNAARCISRFYHIIEVNFERNNLFYSKIGSLVINQNLIFLFFSPLKITHLINHDIKREIKTIDAQDQSRQKAISLGNLG